MPPPASSTVAMGGQRKRTPLSHLRRNFSLTTMTFTRKPPPRLMTKNGEITQALYNDGVCVCVCVCVCVGVCIL